MKPIKLNKSKRIKLFKMCSILFSEYDWTDYAAINSKDELFILCEKTGKSIHWFEFCMTYLPVEMYRYAMHKCNVIPTKAMEIITNNLLALEDFDRYEINPIDYLYKEFKKLKPINKR